MGGREFKGGDARSGNWILPEFFLRRLGSTFHSNDAKRLANFHASGNTHCYVCVIEVKHIGHAIEFMVHAVGFHHAERPGGVRLGMAF
jgi:hypothetical protein